MTQLPQCPKCQSKYVYESDSLLICPECGYEWKADDSGQEDAVSNITRDSNGVELKDGDSVIVIKDLKVKGSSSVVKSGTKVKNIRLVEGDHDIDCKIHGIGAMGFKSQFVRKVLD